MDHRALFSAMFSRLHNVTTKNSIRTPLQLIQSLQKIRRFTCLGTHPKPLIGESYLASFGIALPATQQF